ncbi:hypothetical protein HZS_3358 [Henneguya salminicola]|nr:hypothetical protein HZS_3358 [Henneguya salminicola]
MRTLSLENIILHVALSPYFPFYYGIKLKEIKIESIGPLCKENRVLLGKKFTLYICEQPNQILVVFTTE